VCAGQPDGSFVANPDNCAGYFQCVDEQEADSLLCPSGLLFNEDLGVCDLPENVDCGSRPIY
jgi:hypothetical protein